jgi:hypothetical protein
MTDDTLVEKSSDADLLREMICFAAERLMEVEVGAAIGAGYGEKNTLRMVQRNEDAGPEGPATFSLRIALRRADRPLADYVSACRSR